MGGLAALALLTHCGGMEVQEETPEEVGPRSPAVLRQEASTTMTFGALADARVEQENPTRNFGGESRLVVDTSPWAESYLRFNVSEVTGTVTRAVLRLYASDGTTDGPRLYVSGREWTEGGLTWSNRPGPSGGPLDDKGAITSSTWVEYDVSSAVRGNGQVDFALVGTSGNGTDFASREHSLPDLRPRLVLTVEPGSDCMRRTETLNFDIRATYDGYASQSQPTRRFGSEPVLRVDAAPERLETFLQFRFGLPLEWHVRQAKLRLHATDSTPDGPLLYRASDDWPAFDFDWNTRPALVGGPVGNLGLVETGTWVEYDVSGLVTGDGIYSFGLVPESTNGVDFVSANTDRYGLEPHLLLTVESEPYCTYRGTGGGLTGWTRHYGGAGPERLHALATDARGNLVTAGLFGDALFPNEKGFALARYTADGTPVWTRQVTTGDVRVRALTVTPLGNILVVGNYGGSPDLGSGPLPSAPTDSFSPALFIAKFSPTGQTEWAHGFVATYVRPPEGELEYWAVIPTSVATDANGSLIVGGGFHGQMDLGGGPLSAGISSVYPDDPFPGGFVAKFSWDGHHLWSKSFEAGEYAMPGWVRAVATDPAGNVLVGGHVNSNADLGDGQSGTRAPFIAKYDASGALVWKRLFLGAYGEVVGVQSLGTSGVAFSANLGESFTFGGITYTGGNPEDPGGPDNVSGFTGTLSATGTDGWIRDLGFITLRGLVTGSNGTLTLTGYGYDYDLGGGHVSAPSSFGPTPFVARYSASGGGHLWSRSFDRDFLGGDYWPTLHLAPQPGGSVVVGGDFTSPLQQDGRTYTTRGSSDLLYFQLNPSPESCPGG
ncbi:DUF7594 domain-containing protein [Archangium sp.]|uniref:CBM96 family carbohydrate-binding protein n=1 Tax=Archangium sp. TaxID=1872627 RepID=UPI002D3AF7BD|nr:DNRLRE domain-containing protein [Archangium sp.]HYO55632.1 DNRLRE domain-containing protein [Archangium sp.]